MKRRAFNLSVHSFCAKFFLVPINVAYDRKIVIKTARENCHKLFAYGVLESVTFFVALKIKLLTKFF